MVGELNEHVAVFWDTESDVYLLQAQAPDGLAIRDYGEAIEIPATSPEQDIAKLVVEALDSFRSNVWSREAGPRFSAKEYREFRRKHLSVSIERLANRDIVIRPLHREANGYVALRGEAIVVSGTDMPISLLAGLRAAFEKAT